MSNEAEKQEPVAQPKSEWVSVTNEELAKIWKSTSWSMVIFKQVEDKPREKNT